MGKFQFTIREKCIIWETATIEVVAETEEEARHKIAANLENAIDYANDIKVSNPCIDGDSLSPMPVDFANPDATIIVTNDETGEVMYENSFD